MQIVVNYAGKPIIISKASISKNKQINIFLALCSAIKEFYDEHLDVKTKQNKIQVIFLKKGEDSNIFLNHNVLILFVKRH